MPPAIEVRKLVKRYDALAAVDGIDFTVASGSVFAFLGPNGAGKTTTVEVLEGLRRATSGDVRVLGRDPWTEGAAIHQEIGVIPQEFRFFEKIYPIEAVRYYATLFGVRVDAEAVLRQVALSDKATSRFDTLSGGQKQKLGLALALVNNPKICFLDEPTTGLDPQARRGIWDVIRQLKSEGRTVFLTTHYLEEAQLLADHVAIIHRGHIIAEGTPSAIIAEHGAADRLTVEAGPSMASYLNGRGIPARAVDGKIVVPLSGKADALRVLQAIEGSGVAWQRFAMDQDTLEDVFVALVGNMEDGVVRAPGAA